MLIKRFAHYGFIALLGTFGTVVACSDDATSSGPSSSSTSGSGSSSGGSTTTGETVTVRVTAAAGGTVADTAGKAKLEIPAGALAADTDITLTITPKTGSAVIEVADFGPDGLTFTKPVTLSLKADASLAPAGKKLAVAIGEGGGFKAIAGSTSANGVVSAPIEHFSLFTVIIVDGQAVLVDPASCQDARSKFVACGGDPVGNWVFTDFCPDTKAIVGQFDPFKGKCAQYSSVVDYTSTQDLTITATTTQTGVGTTTLKITHDFPLSCGQTSSGGPSACTDYNGGSAQTVCSDKGGGQCNCVSTITEQKAAGSVNNYTTNGSTWSSSSSSGEYCVSGDILYYRETKDAGDGLLYVLKRK